MNNAKEAVLLMQAAESKSSLEYQNARVNAEVLAAHARTLQQLCVAQSKLITQK